MKNFIIAALAAFVTFAACQKNDVAVPAVQTERIYAVIEQEAAVRTSMDENNNIRWSASDRIAAFIGTSLLKEYEVDTESVGKTSASFSLVPSADDDKLYAGVELDHNVAYYPYASSIAVEKSAEGYGLSVMLPEVQNYAFESFGNAALPMVAVSTDRNFTFRNVCGAVVLKLKGTQKVVSVRVEGRNEERLAGAATVNACAGELKPSVVMADNALKSVVLDCGDGVQLNEESPVEFVIVLPPVVFTEGFMVTITDSEEEEYTVETDKRNEVLRSHLLMMPEVKVDKAQEGDYVDEYGVNHGAGVEVDGLVWAPVNCGYHAEDFKYGKLYQWGRKYGQGYSDDTYSDASVPEIVAGPVDLATGQNPDNAEIFYTGAMSMASMMDWVSPRDGTLWGSETSAENDPCPQGWRVPSANEMTDLMNKRSVWEEAGKMSLPAAGQNAMAGGSSERGINGYYWTSTSVNQVNGPGISAVVMVTPSSYSRSNLGRANGYSVRCVKE